MRDLLNVTYCTLTSQSSGNWGKHAKQHAFIYQFEPLEFYWTYFLALQTTTPKIPPMRLMSLDYEQKNEIMCYEPKPWALTLFCACKYGFFWALREVFPKSMIMLMWYGSPKEWSYVVWKICPSTHMHYDKCKAN